MQTNQKLEVSVGLFVIAGVVALGYMSFNLGGLQLKHADYALSARFSSVGDLKVGDPVKLAGVHVGQVATIALVDYMANVQLALEPALELPEDTIASIRTSGLLGDAYVSLSPGASERNLVPGAQLQRTEAAISISDLIAKYAFGQHDTTLDPASGSESTPGGAHPPPSLNP